MSDPVYVVDEDRGVALLLAIRRAERAFGPTFIINIIHAGDGRYHVTCSQIGVML